MLSPYLLHNRCWFPHFQTYDMTFVTDKVKYNKKEMGYSLYAKKRVDHHIHIGDKLSHLGCMIVNILVWQIRNVVKSAAIRQLPWLLLLYVKKDVRGAIA